jgi:4-aminobutyrate aminotransferase/(S)-3-amino-2-methylpropionate transaminase
LGVEFQRRAREWQKRWPLIGDIRGLGGMQAIELVRSRENREPASEETKKIAQYCYEHGLITITAGTYGNVIRVLVPLVVSDAQMEEGMKVLESALEAVCKEKREEVIQGA